MKIQIIPALKRRDGGALVITAIVLVFIGAVLATYLLLSQNEYMLVARSQTWNSSMALTEAGVEDGLAFINKYEGNFTMVTNWSTAASAAEDNWTVAGNIYSMHRVVSPGGDYYDVTIDNSNPSSPVINSAGMANYTLSASRSPFMLAAAGLSAPASSVPISRKVMVQAVYSALFPGAITTSTNIDLNGNNVRVDSFDSTLTNASAWKTNFGYGIYDITKARANGNVATDSSLVGAISVGQANIYGHLDTGPGGTATVGNNGYVGPLPQSGSGIQAGYSADDMNMVFPPVVLPGGASGWPSVPGNNVITASGNYYIIGINNSLTINAPNVTIYVEGSISLSGNNSITVGTNASRVTLYVGGPSFSTTGNATVNNQTQNAVVLGVYGLPTLTSINFGGNAAYTGTIYAPQAAFSFGGGGGTTYDYVGALVAYNAKLNGHANFHYDESLKRNGPGIGYVPYNWKEITGN
ncbi:MAG: hypothetical protein PHY43_04860 [Verrucomicrobiales bacterium]|nr:hypothetical protein [Verrucomicrobiales bacterium]